jgi:hypothetical protein
MRSIRLLVLFLFAFGAVPGLFAGPCASALLSVYDTSGFTCTQTLGSYTFTAKDVSYTLISGTIAIADTDILVTPVSGVTSVYGAPQPYFGLEFSSGKFSVTGSDTAKYLLTYFWDPGDIRGFVDILDDPVVPPGLAKIATDFCFNGEFGVACPPATGTVTVSDNGTTPHLVDKSVPLSGPCNPLCTIGVQNTIELDGGGAGGSAEFTDFVNQVVVGPEPGTWTGGLLVLAILAGRFRRRGARSIE